jgi:hypothetical protein
MMVSGSAVHEKGFDSPLCSFRKRLIADYRSETETKTPCLRMRLASLARKPSMALSLEQDVGVKLKVKRSCHISHPVTFGGL